MVVLFQVSEDTNPGGCISEATFKADAAFSSWKSVPEKNHPDLERKRKNKGKNFIKKSSKQEVKSQRKKS